MVHRGRDAPPGLDIDKDLAFQRRLWRVERGGQWTVFALVVAALLGAFGPGLLVGAVHATSGDGALIVEYPRVAHAKGPFTVRITVRITAPPPREPSDGVDVWISGELFEAHELREVVPEPESVAFAGDGLTFRFARERSASAVPASIALHLEGRRAGRVRARVAAPGHASVELRQFVYP